MLNYLIFGITYAFAAGVQPGPLQTYIISQTIEKGWRSTLPAIFAPLISDLPIVVLILFLLSSVPDNFIIFLRMGGGLFLIYLGYRAYKSWKNYNPDEAISDTSGKQTLFSAALVNLFNPNPYLGWSLIMGPMLLEGWRIEPVNGIALLVGFYITLIITLAATIIIFAFARKLGPKISKLLLGISSIVLFLFGIYQLSLGIYYFVNMQ
ncbi:MAG: LysE family transporter [Bacteroidales bacterium]|nr:LysE family transporter [Bacteroidales bacterium]